MLQYHVEGILLTNIKDLEVFLNTKARAGWVLVDTFQKGFSIWLIFSKEADEFVTHPRMLQGKKFGAFSGEFITAKVK